MSFKNSLQMSFLNYSTAPYFSRPDKIFKATKHQVKACLIHPIESTASQYLVSSMQDSHQSLTSSSLHSFLKYFVRSSTTSKAFIPLIIFVTILTYTYAASSAGLAIWVKVYSAQTNLRITYQSVYLDKYTHRGEILITPPLL
ncbi:transmembrane protein, putative (macronuclear) [Tetrahymena thermophila SB210]|uniref:Transmembrane protein, putative n=1 Tax=Tetrahymena thermophila (strain SB210) TaxID=312017 RepID=W7X910_TETTS|nr:transmembrane protein, putative [Tetrahymena thermophila SB210]EWS73832.1 transmembrane protein, putative [Tetrahymena thermophila SB210]|eukprot:XP_012653579.1 transmembrane protein, putative [Tetrahymena thermophila SB210]